MSDTDYTSRILKHYFRLALESAGVDWDSDYAAELDAALDPIRELEQRVLALEMFVGSGGKAKVPV